MGMLAQQRPLRGLAGGAISSLAPWLGLAVIVIRLRSKSLAWRRSVRSLLSLVVSTFHLVDGIQTRLSGVCRVRPNH
ncbi:hypothetical protein BDV11DRAFT_110445 [Aspergillus similis]